MKTKYGNLIVKSDPNGATVTVDGQSGRTPTNFPLIEKSLPYDVRIEMSGYEVNFKKVLIKGGYDTKINVSLIKKRTEDIIKEKITKQTDIAEKELFNEVKKLLNLKNTEFVIDESLPDSYCDKYGLENEESDKITCHLRTPEDAIHEGVHAFFAERSRKLVEKLGYEEFSLRDEKETLGDENLEDITARIIETNIQGKELTQCPEDVQKKIESMSKETGLYEDIELEKKIMRLYLPIYEFRCMCPRDIVLYKELKKDIYPIIIYNKLARYIGTLELIL